MGIEWSNKEATLAAVATWPDIFADEFRSGLAMAADILVGQVVARTPTGAGDGPVGHLSNSIDSGEPTPTAKGWIVAIGTPAEYGEVIEKGRTPGSAPPPIEDIANWIWGTRQRFPEVSTEEDAERLAYPIAKAIGRRGFATAPDGPGKGWGMFRKARKAAQKDLLVVFEAMKRRIEARCEAVANG